VIELLHDQLYGFVNFGNKASYSVKLRAQFEPTLLGIVLGWSEHSI